MQQIVTITRQGQITVPSQMRRALSLDKYNKALVGVEDNKIIVEPIIDLLSLGGMLKSKAKKQKNIDVIIKEEENVISKMVST